jgi:hypothetical protein
MSGSAIASVPANRAGMRDGQVSELTVIAPLKEGGGGRLRTMWSFLRWMAGLELVHQW